MKAPAAAVAFNRVAEPQRQQKEELVWLAALFAALAEALATDKTVPAWLDRPGREWPVWKPASSLAAQYNWPLLSEAVEMLAGVQRASPSSRQLAYQEWSMGNGRTAPIMLYESQYTNGRFLGPKTFTLQALYRDAGLELAGAELPDYAAVELEFLSFLVEREEEDTSQAYKWRAARHRFMKEHAGRWLPEVGRQLSAADNQAWSAVGLLLMAVLVPRKRPLHHQPTPNRINSLLLPSVDNVGDCTFCGFCAQVCPSHALRVIEDDQTTRLQLLVDGCIHCGKCERVCDEKALVMCEKELGERVILLCESPRAHCPACNRPTVSQAEISAISHRLGSHPVWLDYCLDCRAYP